MYLYCCSLFSPCSTIEAQIVIIVIFHATCHWQQPITYQHQQQKKPWVTSSRVSTANVSNLSVPLILPMVQVSVAPSTHQVLFLMVKGSKQLATMMGSFPMALALSRWLPDQFQGHPDGDLTPLFARGCT